MYTIAKDESVNDEMYDLFCLKDSAGHILDTTFAANKQKAKEHFLRNNPSIEDDLED